MTIRCLFTAFVLMIIIGLGACTASNPQAVNESGIYDPYENTNRRIHTFNRSFDRAVFRPVSKGYAAVMPDAAETAIANFAANASMPAVMVNGLLQADLSTSALAGSRFFVNTAFGFGGLLNVSKALDIPEVRSDFGETLYVWGAAEGAYIELPILGPSTERDTAGKVVDLFTNPLGFVLDKPERYYRTITAAGKGLSERNRLSDMIDAILYESADSYSQARITYLQRRRFQLAPSNSIAEIDPFELNTEGF
ncbi:MAG: VacJ family lipoprotein [Aestuariivita sp.]|nr:VacJ family lipoprotein [Aestuariivita sp.]MCY4203289.1 VacJ family lipoprotein [Aestuariivita sp.]MCY4287184.1 VacJ family lipoprotein [Aestuariivita sp.]MCY4347508.1 VacJ family lipoprotein [Aestuariivita sp.]